MPKLPVLSGVVVVKILAKAGYYVHHQTGSHMILRHSVDLQRRVTVPNHRELKKGTLLAIIKDAGLTRDGFEKLLGR